MFSPQESSFYSSLYRSRSIQDSLTSKKTEAVTLAGLSGLVLPPSGETSPAASLLSSVGVLPYSLSHLPSGSLDLTSATPSSLSLGTGHLSMMSSLQSLPANYSWPSPYACHLRALPTCNLPDVKLSPPQGHGYGDTPGGVHPYMPSLFTPRDYPWFTLPYHHDIFR